jgi:hypothetical protein
MLSTVRDERRYEHMKSYVHCLDIQGDHGVVVVVRLIDDQPIRVLFLLRLYWAATSRLVT